LTRIIKSIILIDLSAPLFDQTLNRAQKKRADKPGWDLFRRLSDAPTGINQRQ